MKRFLCFVMVLLLLLTSVGALAEDWVCPGCDFECSGNFCPSCGSARPVEPAPTDTPEVPDAPEIPDAPDSPVFTCDDYAVLSECCWGEDPFPFYGIVLKNLSDVCCAYVVTFEYLAADGTSIGTDTTIVPALDPGAEALTYDIYPPECDRVTYSIEYGEAALYTDIRSYVTVTSLESEDALVLVMQNNAAVDIVYTECDVVLLDADGQVIDCERTYFSDENGILASGQTAASLIYVNAQYDSFELYYTACINKTDAEIGTVDPAEYLNKTGEGCEIVHEYSVDHRYSTTVAYVLKNTTDADCAFDCTALFIDSEGKTVDASNTYSMYCAPGDKTLLTFSTHKAYDHIDYCLHQYTPAEWSRPRSGVLETTAEKDVSGHNWKLKFGVTNTGEQAVEYVFCYYILFDEEGNVTEINQTMLCDENYDYKIAPGETLTGEEVIFDDFASFEVFTTAYFAFDDLY